MTLRSFNIKKTSQKTLNLALQVLMAVAKKRH